MHVETPGFSAAGGVDHCGAREALVDGTLGVQRAGTWLRRADFW